MNTILLAALLSLHTADVSTTCIAFHRGGYVEANPLVKSCAHAVIGTAAIDTVGVWWVQSHIHTPWKRALIYGVAAGVAAVPVTHNLRELRRP